MILFKRPRVKNKNQFKTEFLQSRLDLKFWNFSVFNTLKNTIGLFILFLVVTINPNSNCYSQVTIAIKVSASSDDAEERLSNGNVNLTSSDLELSSDGSNNQIIGMRFQNIPLPQGTAIISAYIEFETDELNSGTTNLTFRSEAIDNSPTFTTSTNNISNRSTGSQSMSWNNVSPWTTVSQKHNTPDLANIIQEVINRGGWTTGNSLSVIVNGSGERTAESYNGESANAATLYITADLDLETCYAIKQTGSGELYSWYTAGGSSFIGYLGVPEVETMTLDGSCNTMYTTNNADFGSVNISTGTFSSLGQLGTVRNPTLGNHTLSDIDGMAIDDQSGFIYATERISSGTDLLILIDPNTGNVVQDAFGPNTDYVQVPGAHQDIDDLAFNPCTNELWGISTISSSSTTNDIIVKIDLVTGVATQVLTLTTCDGEGMSFNNDCELYISTGNSGCLGDGLVYKVNLTNGALTTIATIGGDTEALVCCVSAPQPSVLACSIIQTVELCEAGGAELYAEGNGGSGGYSYYWSTGSTSQTVSNLSSGTYIISVTDLSNTTSTCQYTVSSSLSCSTTLIDDVQCFGEADGSASVSVSGGNASISISDNNDEVWIEAECGTIGSNWDIITDNSTSNDEYVTWTGPNSYNNPPTNTNDLMTYTFDIGLAGTYQLWGLVDGPNSNDDSFWVKVDNNTWVRWNSLPGSNWIWDDLHDDRLGSTPISYYLVTGVHTLTIGYRENGVALDKLFFTPNGNTPSGFGNPDNACIPVSYGYIWDNNETTSTATMLDAGTHSVTVTDSNGCTTFCSILIDQPVDLTLSTIDNIDVSCHGGSDGSAEVSASGGVSPYSYSWNSGESSAQITNKSANYYTVVVTDGNSCTENLGITIEENDALACSMTLESPILKISGSDGGASLIASGGTGNFTYEWDNGSTITSATRLEKGIHFVTITDSNNCELTCTVEVYELID